jgi:membrane protein YqaA with SNARE-associated domain
MDIYLGLFLSALLSATLLPGSSEVLIAMRALEGYPALALWAWATCGNTLGSTLNALLGRGLLHYRDRRWFPFSANDLERGHRGFERLGKWSLLLAWMPVLGDALTLVAGVLRLRWLEFLLLVGVGKGLRYALVLGFAEVFWGSG